MTVHPSGSVDAAGNVATRAWSSPPVSTKPSGSTPSAAPTACSGSSIDEGVAAQVDVDPAGPRHVTEVGEQAVGDVDQRRRAQRPAASGAGGVGHLGPAVGLHHRTRRAEPAAQHRQAGRRPARAGRAPRRRPPGRAPPRTSGPPSTVADRGHRDHQRRRCGSGRPRPRTPPPRRTPRRARRPARSASGQSRSGRRRQPDGDGGRPCPHGVDVGRGSGRPPGAPMSAAVGPVPAEVPAVDEHVGGDQRPVRREPRPRRRRRRDRPARASPWCEPAGQDRRGSPNSPSSATVAPGGAEGRQAQSVTRHPCADSTRRPVPDRAAGTR